MRTSRDFTSQLLILIALALMTMTSFAADPGVPFPVDGVVNDQKPGSILFFNVYTSSAVNPLNENARINITNTNQTTPVTVHLFFVDGATCTTADFTLCMSPSFTFSFLASEYDPGTTGYLMVVAIGPSGCPIVHNALVGDSYVRFASGHSAALAAESVAAYKAPPCDDTKVVVDLNFDGVEYERLPTVLALDNIPSGADGNQTMIILNRPSGNFGLGPDRIGFVSGLLYNDEEDAFSFAINSNLCQYRFIFNNTTPRTVPRFSTVVPAGNSGWVKFFTYDAIPLLGAVINYNPAAASSPTAFNGGHNLHKLRSTRSVINIPVFQTNCR